MGFKVLLCRNCGLIFVGDRDRDYRKYYAEEYNCGLGADDRFIENEKSDEDVFKWIIKHLPITENLTLLEIGCNAGFLLKRFKDYGIDVFGVELGQKAAAFAEQVIGPDKIKCCMLEDIEGAERTYDVVILIQTLEHFAYPLNSLRKIRSLLKRDGVLFIEVPNYYALNGFYRLKFGEMSYPSPNHLFVYTPRTLRAFLSKAGFSIDKTIYTLWNIRMIARVDGDDRTVKFENYYRVMIYFRLFSILRKAVCLARLFKGKLRQMRYRDLD
jgi:2-polyprenyl-3-methyl-5-hydroxy-6-metoxy-1,4-benzoquinol methylase